ncbi:MATE family efflux transporter [Neogemmobacter tilapiae]|uniref:Multidrug-efflux transporter n=1 Tax=Neogemmobacter tilapiae TaxID=875041 RepID=A0A918TH06_9RHOB|nr:MATE family efflux transporter [Gemmobacter tilapiae]GHC45715.1 MATE family efflux transporter [Gemmobacter tilapiae]
MTQENHFLSHTRGLALLSLPIIGGHLANFALHVTDTVMMGWYGVTELAALVLATSTYFFLFILGSGVSIGLMGLLSTALGRGDEVQVRRDTRMGLWFSIGYGLVMALPLFWSESLLIALGQKPELAGLAQDYLRIAGFGMVPALVAAVLRSYFSALEKAGLVLWVTLASVVLNAGLNWVFIFGRYGLPEMGVQGAAIATLGSQIFATLILLYVAHFGRDFRRFHLLQRFWRPDWNAMGNVLRLGLPAGLTALAESGLFIAAALMMGWVGKIELAAHGIALQVGALAFMVYMGISNATTVKLGRAYGEGDALAMQGVVKAALVVTLVICATLVSLILLFPEQILRLFLDPSSPDVAEILIFGTSLLTLAAAFQLFDAMQVLALGFLRAVNDAKVPMLLASFSYWLIGLPSSYVLGFIVGWGGMGIWMGLIIGLAAAAGLLMLRYFRGDWSARVGVEEVSAGFHA